MLSSAKPSGSAWSALAVKPRQSAAAVALKYVIYALPFHDDSIGRTS